MNEEQEKKEKKSNTAGFILVVGGALLFLGFAYKIGVKLIYKDEFVFVKSCEYIEDLTLEGVKYQKIYALEAESNKVYGVKYFKKIISIHNSEKECLTEIGLIDEKK